MPPRSAYSPESRTVEAREKPLASSQCAKLVQIDGRARRGGKTLGGEFLARRHALGERRRAGQQQARPVHRRARARKPRQRRHALRRDGGGRRHPVVRLAVPGGEIQDFRVGRGKAKRLGKRPLALRVARHMDHRDGTPLSGFRHRAQKVGGDEGVEPFGRARKNQRAAFFEFIAGAEEIGHVGGSCSM